MTILTQEIVDEIINLLREQRELIGGSDVERENLKVVECVERVLNEHLHSYTTLDEMAAEAEKGELNHLHKIGDDLSACIICKQILLSEKWLRMKEPKYIADKT